MRKVDHFADDRLLEMVRCENALATRQEQKPIGNLAVFTGRGQTATSLHSWMFPGAPGSSCGCPDTHAHTLRRLGVWRVLSQVDSQGGADRDGVSRAFSPA